MVKRIIRFLYLFILCACVLGSIWVRKYFGDVTFDEVLFQITSPIEGTNMGVIYNCIFNLIIPVFLVSLILYIIIFYNSNNYINLEVGFKKKMININLYPFTKKDRIIIFIILSIICIGFGLTKLDIIGYIKDSIKTSTFIEEHYINPKDVNIVLPDKKKNVIVLFLESMESSYADVASGGIIEENLIPNLTKIANDNVNFSNTNKLGGARMTFGATWTAAAMSTQLSGVNYKVNLSIDKIEKSTDFLPGLYYLGDILKDNGYNNELLIGSKAIFGNRKSLFGTHGDHFIFDWSYMVSNGLKKDEDHNGWWGLEDSELFGFAKDELIRLASEDKPFNLTMLTVDTHFEDGFLSSKCDKRFDDQYKNVIYCNDGMINEFIDWIKNQDFYEDTTIILIGDHLTMDVDFFDNYDKNYTRTVYNAFINSSVNSVYTKNRTFMSFDIFPTILASIGARWDGNKLGIGTNLFSGEKTLAEEYGIDYVNGELKYKSQFYNNNFVYKKRDF